jgi:hypothetical protein
MSVAKDMMMQGVQEIMREQMLKRYEWIDEDEVFCVTRRRIYDV